MRILLKLADYSDSSKVGSGGGDGDDDEEDEDFEDCEDMDEEEEKESQAQVIDIDAGKQQCLSLVFGYLDHILLRTQPVPQLVGL